MDLNSRLAELRTAERPALRLTADPGAAASGRVGLLSGSFDPPTVGHLALAEAGLEGGLDLVVLVYAVRTLPKEPGAEPPLMPEPDRVEALERLRRGRAGLAVGLASHGLLVEQVTAARDLLPDASLALLLGSDKAIQLLDERWYDDRDAALDRLLEEAEVRYGERRGDEGSVAAALRAHERWRPRFVRLELRPDAAGVSSREVRERLRRGEDVATMVPPEVLPLLSGG